MSAQPWRERRREYLAAKDRPVAPVIDIRQFLAGKTRGKKGGEGRISGAIGRGVQTHVASDETLAGCGDEAIAKRKGRV
jgi:hypothetical protein